MFGFVLDDDCGAAMRDTINLFLAILVRDYLRMAQQLATWFELVGNATRRIWV
jgi:hypothetical protein